MGTELTYTNDGSDLRGGDDGRTQDHKWFTKCLITHFSVSKDFSENCHISI